MLIETSRLIIRDVEDDDERAFIEMASDGSLGKDIGFDRDCYKWMNGWIVEAKELAIKDDPYTEYLAYTIKLKNTGEIIGSVGCSYYENLGKVGITYFIGADYRNNGYAVEAIENYVQYFFNHYELNEIISTIREANVSSWKAIEKAGFVFTEQKMYKDINNDFAEMYRFYSKVRM